MYAADNPETTRFVRPGQIEVQAAPKALVSWEGVLLGNARGAMMAAHMPSAEVLAKLEERAKYDRPLIMPGPAKNARANNQGNG